MKPEAEKRVEIQNPIRQTRGMQEGKNRETGQGQRTRSGRKEHWIITHKLVLKTWHRLPVRGLYITAAPQLSGMRVDCAVAQQQTVEADELIAWMRAEQSRAEQADGPES
ncbi:hypothetical protein ILYODFUR_037531 [Ilyodon furcidens]|uniref:Uncharacterized protein n=1 Tax=Ilyodon furcidens TaxID=33524 RepID=A0ABV0T3G3_9TELE